MTKRELIRQIATELNIDQVTARKIVQRTLDSVLEAVAKSGRVELRNFGVFEIKRRAARKARNPKTNEEVFVPAKNVLSFQPGKNVAKMISKSRSVPRSAGQA